jgi:hypothetical protein
MSTRLPVFAEATAPAQAGRKWWLPRVSEPVSERRTAESSSA